MEKMEEFVSLAGQDDFVLTDAFPYQSSPFYLSLLDFQSLISKT